MRDDQRDSAPPAGIAEGLLRRLPDQRKTHRDKHSLLIAMILEVRSVNLVALAAALPRPANRTNMRYQLIARFIDNHLVDCDEVMEPFVREVLAQTSAMTSHGSSPCPTNPAPSQCSTIPRARDRLLLVMSLALYFVVSTGLNDANTNPTVDKKRPRHQPRSLNSGGLSWFTRSVRCVVRLIESCLPIPKLWHRVG